jgi:hypothetical protein
MTERDVRKYHGVVGAILALFIVVQVGSGTLIAFNEFLGRGRHVHAEPLPSGVGAGGDAHDDQEHEDSLLQVVHHYGGKPIQAFRVLLGAGVLFMVISGTRIYFWSRNRVKLSQKQGT